MQAPLFLRRAHMAENKAVATAVKPMEIVIDDGSVKVPIKNQEGDELGVFYFRPTDIAIIQRYNNAADRIDEVIEPISSINIGADGTADPTDEEALKAMDEAEKRLFDLCDYIFGGNMSEAFFGKMHPFSPVGGEFYFEKALKQLGTFIGAQFDKETVKISSRVSKYTAKYGKRAGAKK